MCMEMFRRDETEEVLEGWMNWDGKFMGGASWACYETRGASRSQVEGEDGAA